MKLKLFANQVLFRSHEEYLRSVRYGFSMVIAKKISLVGEFAVGKTSLIRRFVERQFEDKYLSTVGVKISKKTLMLPLAGQSAPVEFQLVIWDLEGQTKFEAIAPSYLQGAGGAIVVGAVDRPATLDNLQNQIQLFAAINPNRPVIVALNKSDLLSSDQQRSHLQASRAGLDAKIIDCQLTSAKNGDNVDKLFETLARAMLARA